MKNTFLLLMVFTFFTGENVAQKIIVHDPVMIQQNKTWYLFCKGRGISVWSSTDLKTWTNEKPVFSEPPQWAFEAVKGFRGHNWAPEFSFFN